MHERCGNGTGSMRNPDRRRPSEDEVVFQSAHISSADGEKNPRKSSDKMIMAHPLQKPKSRLV